jgi:hypothetical protein
MSTSHSSIKVTTVRQPRQPDTRELEYTYDVKHDGRHMARLVADEHLTDIPLDAVYSACEDFDSYYS